VTPVTTVTITDPGAMYSSVHLTVTAPTHADLVYDSSLRYDSAPVTVSGGGTGSSLTADLPKGVFIAFEKTEVAVGVIGQDAPCHSSGVAGLAITYPSVHQTIDGFAWNAPATPVITAVAGGRHQVALSFDQEPGTHYEICAVRSVVQHRERQGQEELGRGVHAHDHLVAARARRRVGRGPVAAEARPVRGHGVVAQELRHDALHRRAGDGAAGLADVVADPVDPPRQPAVARLVAAAGVPGGRAGEADDGDGGHGDQEAHARERRGRLPVLTIGRRP
jgi:hypothetical protein